MKKTLQRITNIDIKRISEANLSDHGIYIEFDESNICKARAMIIGPSGSLYEGGYLFFSINFPNNYPYSPPVIKYHSQNNIRIHPNIYVNGKVCLSILGTWSGPEWTPAMDIINVLITIQSLLDSCPLKHEPGYDTTSGKYKDLFDRYNCIIEFNTIKSLILSRLKRSLGEFTIFKDIIDETYEKNKEMIRTKIQTNIEENTYVIITIPLYHISECIDYNNLYKVFKKFDLK